MSNFRKTFLITFFLLATLTSLWLGACAAQATEQPTQIAFVAPDASLATPTSGYAVVRTFEGMQSLRLRSQPNQNSALAGQVLPGEKGKVLGLNTEGTWVLVKFSEQMGWVPVPTLDLVIAQ